ncbi:MAG: recombinase family protein, partial [Clostridium sp.]|nr:recombinase family protein [Clostridium sp.]
TLIFQCFQKYRYLTSAFERPGMKKMLEKIRDGEIKCVIVKDFSRFARDYVELGSYLEQIFPFLGVRFISVNDGYDSNDYQGGIGDIDVDFKGLLYDLYSKDLSEKVRSALAVRKEKGRYLSANAPFGYEKDPKDRHALLVAEDEAEIVRRIFALTLDGYTSVEIARLFNKERIKTPVEFKIEKGNTSRTPKGERFLWGSSTICQILRNEIYIGNIVQKKYVKDFVGGKNHIKPREKWLVSYGHHEPIVNKEDFDKVQEGRGKKRPPQKNQTHPLVGKLVCGGCKKNLQYRRGLNPYFSCYHRYSNAMENCVGKVNAMLTEQYILWQLQDKLEKDGELEKRRMEEAERLGRKIKELREKRKLLLAGIARLKRQSFEAYQDYACGKAENFQSSESAVKSAEEELAELDTEIQAMEKACSALKRGGDGGYDGDIKYVGNGAVEPWKELIEDYVDKVEVFDEQHMEIWWRK